MKMLKSVAEQKYSDEVIHLTPGGLTPLTNAGQFWNMTDIAQGVTKNERIGDRICCSSCEITFNSYYPLAGAPDTLWIWRFIVFVWKDDTVPTLGEILEDTTNPTLSPFNHDTKVKRKILYDKVFNQTFANTTRATEGVAVSVQNANISRKIIIPSKMWRRYSSVYYQSISGGAVNNVYWLAVSEEGTAANTWNMDVYSRINFVDL